MTSSNSRAATHSVHQRQFSAFGLTLGLRGNHDVALEQAVLRLDSLGWSAAQGGKIDVEFDLRACPHENSTDQPASYQLRCDGTLVRCSTDLAPLLDSFEDHAKLLMAYRAEGRLFVHAGAVCWQGCGIVIPGCSRSGKTSLVRSLVEAGAQYYSDEFAVLDSQGRLHPYALPLSIRGDETRPAFRTAVEALGGRAGTLPVSVRLIVVTCYDRDAEWRPQSLSCGQALLSLMANTVAARRIPETAMATLRQTVFGATAFQTLRGDARRVAAAVLAEADALR